ncbi:hypothetical protein ALT_9443 [Aspergillus lentulus]|uniref:Uncharacterized protein n=1 Tax=Aspergillus lentulus TaxID=293939 RepID=A0AAN4TF80_ASPLE|nr:hypothetical protein ALT_9443 [Aspergillus lentulus]
MGEESAESQVPQDYLPFLLSNLEFVTKARILYKVGTRDGLPDHLFQHPDEKIGCQLQRGGQPDLTRLLWYFLYHQKEHSDNFMKWCSNMIMADVIGRYVVQTEVHERDMLRSKRKELQLCNSPEKSATIESVIRRTKRTLENTNDIYRRLYRTLWELQEHMPSGPLCRAFLAWRANPDWYLCDWLRRECAGRGGWCGRSCGCCEKPRDTGRLLNRGHCTLACSCYIQTKGKTEADDPVGDNWGTMFEDKTEIVPAVGEEFNNLQTIFEEKHDMYARRLCRAYIWGIDVLNEIEDEEEFS